MMSWFIDIMQDFITIQGQLNQTNEALKKSQTINQQQAEQIRKLTQQIKEEGDGNKSQKY